MTYTSLIVNVDPGHANAAVLTVARLLAQAGAKSVTGIAAYQPLKIVYGDNPFAIGPLETDRHNIERDLREAEAEFRAALEGVGSIVSWRATLAFNAPGDYVAREARCADLMIVGTEAGRQPDAERRVDLGDLVMACGRPVLVVPTIESPLRHECAVIGWTDTREARRAISDALPLLRRSARVVVVELAEGPDVGAARSRVDDVAAWLLGHGITAEAVASRSGGYDAIELDGFASDRNADLLVAGAYGHSRVREWAFGGVTRDLLMQPKRCTLLSH